MQQHAGMPHGDQVGWAKVGLTGWGKVAGMKVERGSVVERAEHRVR